MDEEDVLKEAKEVEKELEVVKEEVKRFKSPLWYILGIFLALLIVLMIVPYYAVRLDPNPKYIPTIDEVVPSGIEVNDEKYEIAGRNDFLKFVDPTDPIVKQIADRIAVKACDGNRICQAKAVYYFVRDNYDYVADPVGKEYVEHPKEFLSVGGGDCESGSISLISLMEAIGIDAQFVFITNHAYVRIRLPEALKRYRLDDDWVYLDWTCKYCEFGEIPWRNVRKEASYLDV